MTINRVWRKRVKNTGVLGEVGGGAAIEDPLRGREGEEAHVCADAGGVA
jgi:hypothetical protein